MEETVTITASEYEKLLKDSLVLEMLMDNGVEYWDGYEKTFQQMVYTAGILFTLLYFSYNWSATSIKIEVGNLENTFYNKLRGYLLHIPISLFKKITKWQSGSTKVKN